MGPNRCEDADQVASRSGNAPQNSIRKNACRRVYAPACKIPSRQAKLAIVAAPGPVQFYGTLAAPSLLARKSLSFANFLREPQVRDWVLAQNDSDAVAMMDEIRRDHACDKSLKDTRAYSPSGQSRPLSRYGVSFSDPLIVPEPTSDRRRLCARPKPTGSAYGCRDSGGAGSRHVLRMRMASGLAILKRRGRLLDTFSGFSVTWAFYTFFLLYHFGRFLSCRKGYISSLTKWQRIKPIASAYFSRSSCRP